MKKENQEEGKKENKEELNKEKDKSGDITNPDEIKKDEGAPDAIKKKWLRDFPESPWPQVLGEGSHETL